VDLCFRKTEEAKTKARQNLSPTSRMDQVPGTGLGEKRPVLGPRGSAIILSDGGLLSVGGREGAGL